MSDESKPEHPLVEKLLFVKSMLAELGEFGAATVVGDAIARIRSTEPYDEVVSALQQFVDYYDQAGMPDEITPDMDGGEDGIPDRFDEDEVLNVFCGRLALAEAAKAKAKPKP